MASKSLGTLTLDLVAKIGGFTGPLDKASRKTKSTTDSMKKDLKVLSVAAVAAATSIATGTAVMIKSQIEAANQITRLAQISGTGTTEFQKYAAGAKVLGIEQDKLSDIFKDTADKVGDFLQTGAGPLADFFENIAPQIGVTANEFRNLSGPQALELYVSSLEKANVSQNEMTFFMEAIASDATLLLPLLRNGAAGFKEFGDAAQDAGAIMSEGMIDSAQKLEATMFLLDQSTKGFKNQIGEALLPVLSDAAVAFYDVSSEGSVAVMIADALTDSFKFLTKAGVGVYGAFSLIGKGLGSLGATFAATDIDFEDLGGGAAGLSRAAYKIYQNLTEVERTIEESGDAIGEEIERLAEIMNKIDSLGDSSNNVQDTENKIEALAKYLKAAREAAKAEAGIAKVQFDNREAVKDTIAGLQMQAESLGKTTAEMELHKLQLLGATEAQQELAKSALGTIAAYDLMQSIRTDQEKLTDDLRERLQVLKEIAEVEGVDQGSTALKIFDAVDNDSPEFSQGENIDAARIELQNWYAEQLELLRVAREERADLNDEWNEKEAQTTEQYQQRLVDIYAAKEAEQRKIVADGYIALLDIAGEYYEGMQGEQAGYARAAIALAQTLLDEDKRKALQSIYANTESAAMKAYDSLAGIPYVGPALGAAAAGVIYVAGGAAAAKVTGLAHEGIDSIPQTGTWLLEAGERVTTEKTSAKLDETLDNVQATMSSEGGGGSSSFKIVNAFDTSVIDDYLTSGPGEKTILNIAKNNPEVYKSVGAQ